MHYFKLQISDIKPGYAITRSLFGFVRMHMVRVTNHLINTILKWLSHFLCDPGLLTKPRPPSPIPEFHNVQRQVVWVPPKVTCRRRLRSKSPVRTAWSRKLCLLYFKDYFCHIGIRLFIFQIKKYEARRYYEEEPCQFLTEPVISLPGMGNLYFGCFTDYMDLESKIRS